jgi:hypothetical protein
VNKYPGTDILAASFVSKDWNHEIKQYNPPSYEAPHVLSYSEDLADPAEDQCDSMCVM